MCQSPKQIRVTKGSQKTVNKGPVEASKFRQMHRYLIIHDFANRVRNLHFDIIIVGSY